jgi:hypothetical protein
MHLIELLKLEAGAPGFVLEHYRALTGQADAECRHNGPAALAKAQFEKDWETNPNELVERVRNELAARAAAAERTARGE